MKFFKLTALLAVTALVPINAYAEKNITPVYEYFCDTDVNGSITVELADGLKADVSIAIDTPELTAQPYYSEKSLDSSDTYTFRLEGRDKTAYDYQTYTVNMVFYGEGSYMKNPYTFTVDIPDGNDHPDSFADYKFSFKYDEKESSSEYETVSEDGNEKTVLLHMNKVVKGDVNGDGSVNSIDASQIMAEYSLLSTDKENAMFASWQTTAGDLNNDGSVNSIDASLVMAYYSYVSTHDHISIEDFIKNNVK